MSRLERQRDLADARNARALARADEAGARRAEARGDADAAYEAYERAGLRLDHADPLRRPAR